MAGEFGYVYILTNPSMPGLVKVGKTTTTPNQRMSELHSTGVPTPFELEFSISVNDCHKAERSAHKALHYCRVSANREFFQVTAKQAIEKILDVVDECEVVDFRESHGVEKIEEEVRRRKIAKEEDERRKKLEIENRRKQQDLERRAQQSALLNKLNALHSQLTSLGPRPVKEEPGGWVVLSFCYLPIPIGWIFWLGMLSVFGSKSATGGFVCMALIAAGYFANQASSQIDERNERKLKPFYEIDEKIRDVERELDATGYSGATLVKKSPEVIPKLIGKAGPDLIPTDRRGFEKPARKIGRAE